jgi:hypothetical protein
MPIPRHRLPRTLLLAAGLSLAVPFLGTTGAAAEDGEIVQPVDFGHSVLDAPAPVPGAVFGSPPGGTRIGTAICTTPVSTAANVNTDCEATAGSETPNLPHNETSIAVNPTDHANIIGGANDYQLALNPGGQVSETVLSRAHVSFDGGRSWSEYPLTSNSAYQATGDPSVAFDLDGHAYYATLGFRFVGPTNGQNPDVLVADSGDKGRSWTTSRIATGSGVFSSVGHLLDKEWVTAWGHGNAIVTFGDFSLGQRGGFLSADIFASVTHDHGATWSTPVQISGDLHQAFVSVPTVAADGRVFVAFLNTTDLTTGRDDYEVVEVSPATGARVAGPYKVATVVDGSTDYPVAFGRQTYQDSLFRSWAAGNITADPTDAGHLAVVWSDMRNSQLPAPADPYAATTNSDVVVSESHDHGRTWSAPAALTRRNDQFMPWGAFDASGALRIGSFDRAFYTANHLYDYSVATRPAGGTAFAVDRVTTVASDPTTGDRWFAATVNPAFPFATLFIGDYSNIAVVPGTTSVVAYWTDLREIACFPATVCRHGEDAYFGYAP